MCGIFGYVGREKAPGSLVVNGLKKLEYRGYDSWGMATADPGRPLRIFKQVGKISKSSPDEWGDLEEPATSLIAHTRWATHGKPDHTNAHPHLSRSGRIAIVHNGIIENHVELRHHLEADGFHFKSQTDTEVIAHLLDRELSQTNNFHDSLAKMVLQLRGAFGLAIVDAQQPDHLFAVRLGSPLVIGVADGKRFIASDATALGTHTNNVIYLDDREWADVTADRVDTFDFSRALKSKSAQTVEIDASTAELGDFQHFMQKEIFEQPTSIRNALSGRILHGEATTHFAALHGLGERDNPARIKILACGSSWHAGLIGKHYFEELAQIPTEVEYASEFRYRNAVIEPNTLIVAISQSGETADTLAGLKEAMRRGAKALGLVNVVASSIARECGRGVYLHAGPEFGVAATKSFTNQLVVLLMLAIHFGRKRGMSLRQGLAMIQALEKLPEDTEKVLSRDAEIRAIAAQYVEAENFLYIGRSMEYPIALEGALKLKEVSYIHAEGLPAAELKHGPIALIAPEMPTVVICTQTFIQDKVASNVQEIRARGGKIIVIGTEETDAFDKLADHVITVPTAHDLVSPILATIPTQLLAYHLAVLRGCDVDQPRNLAKSVTVE